jgi:hypothetical protein
VFEGETEIVGVGELLGVFVGEFDGELVGELLGELEGDLVGEFEGVLLDVGLLLGVCDGVGVFEGVLLGVGGTFTKTAARVGRGNGATAFLISKVVLAHSVTVLLTISNEVST